jgi:hypothetical protein
MSQENYPLPLGQAVRELPGQYVKVLLRPGVRTFLEEQGKAAWNIIWVQFALQAVVYLMLGVSDQLYTAWSYRTLDFVASPLTLQFLTQQLTNIAFFFGAVGIQFALARAFKGQGSFVQHLYNMLLLFIPLDILASLVTRVLSGYLANAPYETQSFLGLALPVLLLLSGLVYGIILNINAVSAAHRLSGGKATAVVLIPWGVGFVLLSTLLLSVLHLFISGGFAY